MDIEGHILPFCSPFSHLPSDVALLPLQANDASVSALAVSRKGPQLDPICSDDRANHEASGWLGFHNLLPAVHQLHSQSNQSGHRVMTSGDHQERKISQ